MFRNLSIYGENISKFGIQGEKELRKNFDEPANGQNSFVNNLYLKYQSKKFLPTIER